MLNRQQTVAGTLQRHNMLDYEQQGWSTTRRCPSTSTGRVMCSPGGLPIFCVLLCRDSDRTHSTVARRDKNASGSGSTRISQERGSPAFGSRRACFQYFAEVAPWS